MKMKIFRIGTFSLIMIITYAACSPGTFSSPADRDVLEDPVWILETYGPNGNQIPTLKDYKPTLRFEFEDYTASGNSSCNHYSAGFSIKGSKITFDQTMSTLMACIDQQAMEQESNFLLLLSQVSGYIFEDGCLVLITDSGDSLHFLPNE